VAPHVKLAKTTRRARDIGRALEDAFAVARAGMPGPAFVECPVDLLYDEASVRKWYSDVPGKTRSISDLLLRLYVDRHLTKLFAGDAIGSPARVRKVAIPLVRPARVQAAARSLARASRPLAVVGSQTLAAREDTTRIAVAISQLGIPTYLSGMARGLLGRDHPLQLRHQRRQALREADCVILVGGPCDFRLEHGRHIRRSSTLIAASRSRREARLNRRPDVEAIDDAAFFLERLADQAGGTGARCEDWLVELRDRDARREAEIEQQSAAKGNFVNPIALLRAIDRIAGETAIFVADGGDFVATASYVVRPRGPRSWLDPGPFGTLGVGAGFALGAALCRPGAEVWILFGDGTCGYSLAEFDSFARHGIPIVAVVGNDACWTQIAREQVKMLKDDAGTVLARSAYREVADSAEGILVKTTAEVHDALVCARAARKGWQPRPRQRVA
jgi:thiamine pyrophosphate-dependent acetolactate synthase large subunit-like protein